MASFSVIPVTVLRLIYIFTASKSADPTFDDFSTALATEIATNFSIIFACISFIKPFLDNIETGLLASRLRTRSLGRTQDSAHHTALRYAKSLFKSVSGKVAEEREWPLVADAQQPSKRPGSYELSNLGYAAHASAEVGSRESLRDGNVPREMFITRTTDVEIVRTDQKPKSAV